MEIQTRTTSFNENLMQKGTKAKNGAEPGMTLGYEFHGLYRANETTENQA
jgi:hypothetical protein